MFLIEEILREPKGYEYFQNNCSKNSNNSIRFETQVKYINTLFSL